MKTCTKCNITKPKNEFYKDSSKKDGYRNVCKECEKAYQRERYEEKGDQINKRTLDYYYENREKRLEYASNRYECQTGKVKECTFCKELFLTSFQTRNRQKYCSKKCRREFKKDHIKKLRRRREAKRRENDPQYRLHCNMRAAIYRSIRQNKDGRSWEGLVGYSLDDLKKHLESQFEDGMTWDNYGKWHIDHIVPQSVFNYSKPEHLDFKRCWSLNNLQPLWSDENIAKSNRLSEVFQPSLMI